MFFLQRYKQYLVRWNKKKNMFINRFICGIVVGTYRDTVHEIAYYKYSHNGQLDGPIVINTPNYFRYTEMLGNYIHGINVKVKQNVIVCAGRYKYGKPDGYYIHLCKDNGYNFADVKQHYIGAYYKKGWSQYIDLIEIDNGRIVSYDRRNLNTHDVFKDYAVYLSISKSHIAENIKYIATKSNNYQIYYHRILVKEYKFDSDKIVHSFTYHNYRKKYKFELKNHIADNDHILKIYREQKISESYHSDDEIDLDSKYYRSYAKFEWNNKLLLYFVFPNIGDQTASIFKYDQLLKEWHRDDIRFDNET